jgi:pimeloyl-ACP methyl ester carboxylesterase
MSTRLDHLDSGGDGPVLVFLHGLMMDETLWTDVVAELSSSYRCIVPLLPLGAHRHPLPEADLSLHGVAGLVLALLDDLDLDDVMLIGNDTGGAIAQVVVAEDARRIGGLVLVSCEAYDNFPPGLTGRTLVASGRLSPRLFGLFVQQLRLKVIRRSPLAFGTLTKYGDAVTRRWIDPVLSSAEIRRDAVRLLRAITKEGAALAAASAQLPEFPGRGLVVWAEDDPVMPPEHGVRLAGALGAELVTVPGSRALVPLDQPAALAAAVRAFVPSRRPVP